LADRPNASKIPKFEEILGKNPKIRLFFFQVSDLKKKK
jgi:hypothetical protein